MYNPWPRAGEGWAPLQLDGLCARHMYNTATISIGIRRLDRVSWAMDRGRARAASVNWADLL